MNFQDVEKLIKVKRACDDILKTSEHLIDNIQILKSSINEINDSRLRNVHRLVIGTFYTILKKIAEDKNSVKQEVKSAVIEALNVLFNKTQIEHLELFLNIYGFLLNEIYDPNAKNFVANVNEEYKLLILECIISLAKSLTWDVIVKLYSKEHAPKLCQILYVSLEIAKTEQLKKLRITAIYCIMTLARVHDVNTDGDVVLQAQIADVFMFFLPGIASGLRDIALEDEKVGHGIAVTALRAFGKLVKLLMQSPVSPDENPKQNYEIILKELQLKKTDKQTEQNTLEKRWKNEEEIKNYLQNSKRDENWFQQTDSKLQLILKALAKLTYHSHPKVREELSNICVDFIKCCSNTMLLSLCYIAEILIVLSEDEYETVSNESKKGLAMLSEKLSSNVYKLLKENLEEKFYDTVTDLPRIFNTLDDQKQLSTVNMLVGYLQIFGQDRLVQILHSPAHLKRLIFTLISITKMETSKVTQLEDFVQNDFDNENESSHLPAYKKFRYIQNQKIVIKIEAVCSLLAVPDAVNIITDCLLNIVQNNEEDIKEAIYILNEVLLGLKDSNSTHIFENVIKIYLDPDYWDLPLHTIDSDGNKYSLGEIQNNILQVCLLVEGLGKIALALGSDADQFLLKIMYPILERAGSPQPLIRRVGLMAVRNLSSACGYANVTELINVNADYFSYHVIKKLRRIEQNENVLNVLCVVMQHSSEDVLSSISNIIEGILVQTCDKYFQEQKANSYLHIFKTFILCLMRWLNIKPIIHPVTSKEKEMEAFKVSGINEVNDFSDDIMGKSAEEMFKEDMEKSQEQLQNSCENYEEVEEYKKPEPPMHVKLTVLLLERCLHFLPSKDRTTKLFALEILKNGLEIVRDWEDELLPLVHKIWSPLVNRFKSTEEPVIVNYSFQLLTSLARLSKDFIRSRTAKEVLPDILRILDNSSKESYLKDKGSPYRYTQAYKLQLTILEDIGRIIIYLDMSETHTTSVATSVMPYLSDKQPVPLQELALKFFKDLALFDKNYIKEKVQKLFEEKSFSSAEYIKNKKVINSL